MPSNDTPQSGNSGDRQLDRITATLQRVQAKMEEANQLMQEVLDQHPILTTGKQGKYRGNTRALMNKGAIMMTADPGLFAKLAFTAIRLYHRGLQIDGLAQVVSSAKKLGDGASRLLGSVKAEAAGMTNDLTDGVKFTLNNPLGDDDIKRRLSNISLAYTDEAAAYGKGLKTSRQSNRKLRDSSNDVLTEKDAEIQRLKVVNQVLADGTLPAGALPGQAKKATQSKRTANRSSKKNGAKNKRP